MSPASTAPSDGLRLPERGEIHVWRLDLAKASRWSESCRNILAPDERERAARMLADTQKRRHLATQCGLRHLLGGYLEVPPASLRFERGSHGKPRLAGTAENQGTVFNLSHSGDIALFAVSTDTALGVDVEWRRPDRAGPGLARKCLTPDELRYWEALAEPERSCAFFDFWTCKEAFVKAVGRGLGLGLRNCALTGGRAPRFTHIPERHGSPEEWSLWPLDLGDDYSAALCARIARAEVCLREMPDPLL